MNGKNTTSRIVHISLTVILTVSLAIILLWWFFHKDTGKKTDQLTIGALPGSTGLVYIAQDRSFFTENGIIVNIVDYQSGIETIDSLLKKDVDVSWSAEFPVVCKVFEKKEISILAVLSRFTNAYLFCRKTTKTHNISHLKGKKIGVPMNTNAVFYLARFLELHGLSMKDIFLVDIPAAKAPEAMTGGEVDAVVTWERFAEQIRTKLSDKVAIWPVQSSQPGYGIITGRNDWIAEHRKTVHRFLKSLTQAEHYLIHNPKAGRKIIQKRITADDDLMKKHWSEYRYSLSLDQSLITAMEGEARWMISNKLTNEKTVPDFLDYIYEDALKAIKPEAVNIIR